MEPETAKRTLSRLCLSVCLSVCLYVCLSVVCLSVCLNELLAGWLAGWLANSLSLPLPLPLPLSVPFMSSKNFSRSLISTGSSSACSMATSSGRGVTTAPTGLCCERRHKRVHVWRVNAERRRALRDGIAADHDDGRQLCSGSEQQQLGSSIRRSGARARAGPGACRGVGSLQLVQDYIPSRYQRHMYQYAELAADTRGVHSLLPRRRHAAGHPRVDRRSSGGVTSSATRRKVNFRTTRDARPRRRARTAAGAHHPAQGGFYARTRRTVAVRTRVSAARHPRARDGTAPYCIISCLRLYPAALNSLARERELAYPSARRRDPTATYALQVDRDQVRVCGAQLIL